MLCVVEYFATSLKVSRNDTQNNAMLYDSPDLVIHRTEIWAVWRPQVLRKKVWRFLTQQFKCCMCTARRAGALPCWNTKSLPDTLRIASMTTLWRREAASKKSLRDVTRILCFVTTMNLPRALQVYSTVFVKKCMRLHFLSASLYFSKRGAYWDRLCRDVVGRWLVGCHARALWPNGAS